MVAALQHLPSLRERPAVRAWLTLAVAALALSTAYSVLLVVSRTPGLAEALHVRGLFPLALAQHVTLSTVVWFLSFGAALWAAGALRGSPALHGLAFALAALGVAGIALAAATGGPVYLSNYLPVQHALPFLGGLGLFFAAVSVVALCALPASRAGWRLAQRGTFAAGALLAALVLLAAFAAFAASLAGLRGADIGERYFEVLNWAPGHVLQIVFVLLMVTAWQYLARTAGVRLPAPGLTLALMLASVVLVLVALALQALYPPESPALRKAFTILMGVAAWPAALPAFAGIARAIPRTGRSPLHAALVLSGLLFATGCVLGAFVRTDSTMVPAHYHGTIGAVTLAFMAVCLDWQVRSGLAETRPRLQAAQAWIYGLGLLLMVAGLAWAGGHGAPRKTPWGAAPLEGAQAAMAASLSGVGGLLAIIGAALFVVVALRGFLRPAALPGAAPLPLADAEPVPPNRRRDVRLKVALSAGAAVVVLGTLLAAEDLRPAGLRKELERALAQFPAIDRLSHVAERRQEEIDARFQQGVVMLHAKQYDYALTAFHRVLQLAPTLPEAHVNMGYALLGQNRYAEARDFFEGALALRGDQLNAYYGLAVAYEGLDDLERAVGAMRTWQHLAKPDDPYQPKAIAALWEWESALQARRGKDAPVNGSAPAGAAQHKH